MNLDLRNTNIENTKLWIEREEVIIHDTNSAREHKSLWGFPLAMSNGSECSVCGVAEPRVLWFLAKQPCTWGGDGALPRQGDSIRIASRSPERKTGARRLRRNPNLFHPTFPCSYPIMMGSKWADSQKGQSSIGR